MPLNKNEDSFGYAGTEFDDEDTIASNQDNYKDQQYLYNKFGDSKPRKGNSKEDKASRIKKMMISYRHTGKIGSYTPKNNVDARRYAISKVHDVKDERLNKIIKLCSNIMGNHENHK